MSIPMIASSDGNFRAGREGRKIEYIVVHYTANNGDTARGNAQYFSRTNVTASAHYFVDENTVVQSVHERDTAWHCGASKYLHPACRNYNSLGVELCSRIDSEGNYYFLAATVGNAAELVRSLMEKYHVPPNHVLRHFDVTGKSCPRPFVDNEAAWAAFQKKLEVKTVTVPEAKKILAEKAGLSPETIAFLDCYKYAEDLLVKLAGAMR